MATFCLIHGKWHDSTSWGRLPDLVRAAGHDAVTPDLPYEDPRTTYADRIQPALAALHALTDPVNGERRDAPALGDAEPEAEAEAVEEVDTAGTAALPPVVVVGHSLAAGYAPLVAAAMPGARLVYLCPAPVGPFAQMDAPMRSSRPGFEFPRNREDGTSVWNPAEAIAVMYPRLPAAGAQALAARLKPGSSPSDRYPLSKPPDVPTTFVYALHDEFFEPDWSRWVAREVAHVEPIELDTGHFAMIEAPDEVARILHAAAR